MLQTYRKLSIIEKAYPYLEEMYEIKVKPHPGNPVNLTNYPLLTAQLTDKPISELFPSVDITLASVHTSAALDAFCAGIPVINYLDPYDINFSNLRGIKGVEFISIAEELFQALERIKSRNCKSENPENFFWLEPDLPR